LKDTYNTLADSSESYFLEKRSKFFSFAFPVESIETVNEILAEYRRKYYDARHVCYAYRLGYEGEDFRVNDNGEPSGTAGKPIFGQMLSKDVTDVLIIVVRYFGGIKLGTSGLIVAYRQAASDVLDKAEIITRTIDVSFTVKFPYERMNDVMHIIKDMEVKIISQDYDKDKCVMKLCIRKSLFETLQNKLKMERLIV
jgi:uncharacterized YigZ family protein